MSAETSSRRTRVVQSPVDWDKWQAQYFEPNTQTWLDLGEPTLTYEEADEKRHTWSKSEHGRRVSKALELQTNDDGLLFLMADATPGEMRLSVTDRTGGVEVDVRLDVSDLLRIMAWGTQYLAEREAGL